MKAGQSFRCLFWAILYCVLYLVNAATDEDLMDFDFTDLKEIDWNYENDSSNETTAAAKGAAATAAGSWKTHGHQTVTFDDDMDDLTENQVHPFDWREKVLRTALSKALTNKALRQKFVEVMPILRVLSKQQRLALSALISAQVNAKKGQELKLEQVRMMFGDDKKLLIPIVYDIANLVGSSARKYLQLNYDVLPAAERQQMQPKIERRTMEVGTASEELDTEDIGALPSAAMGDDSSLEDFFGEMSDDVLDAQSINEELQASVERSKPAEMKTTKTAPMTASVAAPTKTPHSRSIGRRARRNAAAVSITSGVAPTAFVHKLIRSIPLSVNEEDLQRGTAGRTVKLNTTSFAVPNENELHVAQPVTPPTIANGDNVMSTALTAATASTTLPAYHEIEDLAFASLNGTEISLNDDLPNGSETDIAIENEPLPNPEELIAGPRYRINGNKVRLIRPKLPPVAAKRKRVQLLRPQQQRPPSGPPSALDAALVPAPKKCERFTASMCIRTDDYPLDQIMGSIRRHKNAMTALLAEFHDKPHTLDFTDEFDEFSYNKHRREDENGAGGNGGSMCQSIVRYARPQKARSASGEWKYIVNTGQHTQTLRLEKCSNPQDSCSYLAQNYRSHCSQIYNYHRLLSWDKTRGLHVDIFKVPTCCSCQIDGYRQQFPPLDTIKAKNYSPAYSPEPYTTINEEFDYNDDEDEDDLGFQYTNGFNQHKRDGGYDANELQLGSKNVRTKVQPPSSPTVGSYLSPPGSNEYDTNYAYKGSAAQQNHHQHHHHQHYRPVTTVSSTSAATKSYYNSNQLSSTRRRPYKSLSHGFDGESRADLEIAPSETHTDKEVNIIGTAHAGNDKTRQRVQQKRKRIYSVPHTATTSQSHQHQLVSTAASDGASASLGHGHGAFNGHGGYHGQAFGGGGGGSGSSATTTAYQTSAASPSYYTPGVGAGGRKNAIAGKSKPRYRVGSTSTASVAVSQSSLSLSPSSAATSTTPSTTESTAYRQRHSPAPASASDAAYPPIYQISSIFNATSGISASGGSGGAGPKRINYSYHPIIDFFENNSKRTTTTNSLTSTTVPSSIDARGQQLYPHKIPKYSSAVKAQPASVSLSDSTAIDANGLQNYRKRRIGLGAGGYGGSGFSTDMNAGMSGKGNDLTMSASSEDNVWHPVLVK